MRLLQLLHEAKPSSITGVIGLYLQLDSRIMSREKQFSYRVAKTIFSCNSLSDQYFYFKFLWQIDQK